MIYTQGYVRRRLSSIRIPSVSGSHFLELSDVGGSGCSGSPIFKLNHADRGVWDVFGVYIGERLNDRATSVAYAAAADAYASWSPYSLGGVTLADESANVDLPA